MAAVPSTERLLADNQGFQLVRQEVGMIFVNKRTRGMLIAAFVSFGLSTICGVVALGFAATALGDPSREKEKLLAAGPIMLVAVVAGLVGYFAYRRYRERQQGSGDRLIAGADALRTADGKTVAALSEVSCDTSIDWTDGMGGFRFARILSLRWPGGSRPIYKSYDKSELERLRSELASIGIRAER